MNHKPLDKLSPREWVARRADVEAPNDEFGFCRRCGGEHANLCQIWKSIMDDPLARSQFFHQCADLSAHRLWPSQQHYIEWLARRLPGTAMTNVERFARGRELPTSRWDDEAAALSQRPVRISGAELNELEIHADRELARLKERREQREAEEPDSKSEFDECLEAKRFRAGYLARAALICESDSSDDAKDS